jgi:hypothetical protein
MMTDEVQQQEEEEEEGETDTATSVVSMVGGGSHTQEEEEKKEEQQRERQRQHDDDIEQQQQQHDVASQLPQQQQLHTSSSFGSSSSRSSTKNEITSSGSSNNRCSNNNHDDPSRRQLPSSMMMKTMKQQQQQQQHQKQQEQEQQPTRSPGRNNSAPPRRRHNSTSRRSSSSSSSSGTTGLTRLQFLVIGVYFVSAWMGITTFLKQGRITSKTQQQHHHHSLSSSSDSFIDWDLIQPTVLTSSSSSAVASSSSSLANDKTIESEIIHSDDAGDVDEEDEDDVENDNDGDETDVVASSPIENNVESEIIHIDGAGDVDEEDDDGDETDDIDEDDNDEDDGGEDDAEDSGGGSSVAPPVIVQSSSDSYNNPFSKTTASSSTSTSTSTSTLSSGSSSKIESASSSSSSSSSSLSVVSNAASTVLDVISQPFNHHDAVGVGEGSQDANSESSNNSNAKPVVMIVACTKSQKEWKSRPDEAFVFKHFLPSVVSSVTPEEHDKYNVQVLLAYDRGDQFWEKAKFRDWTRRLFPQIQINIMSILKDDHTWRKNRIPFNEACQAAYEYGADYIVRVNDDTEFDMSGWITLGVSQLSKYEHHVGVVGPKDRGNSKILTHDMVHRVHLDIFDRYYPEQFDNWWIDDWITGVYGDERTTMEDKWTVINHSGKTGTMRYNVNEKLKHHLEPALFHGEKRIKQYLSSRQKTPTTKSVSDDNSSINGTTTTTTPSATFNERRHDFCVLGTSRVGLIEGPMGDFVIGAPTEAKPVSKTGPCLDAKQMKWHSSDGDDKKYRVTGSVEMNDV